MRLARDNFAPNGGPTEADHFQMAADALHERVFDLSIAVSREMRQPLPVAFP